MQQPRDFSMYGAVDLGARQAAAQRRQQAAARAASAAPGEGADDSGAGQASASVFEVTEETFNDDVVSRSRTTPVIVDLWAEWCGPCKQLSPVLEKLANEANGAWVLAKVDVDANPRLAQAFQAQSIPMVVAIIGGQMVDAFLGAMPEAQVKQWLTQVLSVAEQLGVQTGAQPAEQGGAEAVDDLPPALAAARDAMEDGDLDAAAQALEKALADAPADPLAKSWLAQVNLIRRASSYDPATVSREAAASPGDIAAQLRMADVQMASGDAEEAFDRVLGVIKRTSGEERNTARLHLLDLFEVLPPNDDRVKKARTQLTLLLF
jgi:putative thioredoxin